jgi:TolB-like protein
MGGPASGEEKPRLAVMSFTSVDGSTESSNAGLTLFFETAIQDTGAYDVIEQSRVADILKGQEYSHMDFTDSSAAVKIGKLLSANNIVLGASGKFEGEYFLNVKIIEVETGKILNAERTIAPSLSELADSFDLLAKKLAGLETAESYDDTSDDRVYQPQRKLMFEDDFSNNSNKWYLDEYIWLSDGEINIHSPESDYVTYMPMSFSDGLLKSDLYWNGGADNYGYGIMFRIQDISNYYVFFISANGYCSLQYLYQAQYYPIYNWFQSDLVMRYGYNAVEIELADNYIAVYLNDEFLISAFDSTFLSGGVGFFSGAGVHSSFDNLEVWSDW